jgi:hypothetical protein
MQRIHLDFKGDMQIEIMLVMKVKGTIRGLEKGEKGTIIHPVKGMQNVSFPAGFGFPDGKGVSKRQPKKILVEFSGFL